MNHGKATLYIRQQGGGCKRIVTDVMLWDEHRQLRSDKAAVTEKITAAVYIRLSGDLQVAISPRDYIVRGECPADGNCDAKTLMTQYGAHVVTASAKMDYGAPRMQHWELEVG